MYGYVWSRGTRRRAEGTIAQGRRISRLGCTPWMRGSDATQWSPLCEGWEMRGGVRHAGGCVGGVFGMSVGCGREGRC